MLTHEKIVFFKYGFIVYIHDQLLCTYTTREIFVINVAAIRFRTLYKVHSATTAKKKWDKPLQNIIFTLYTRSVKSKVYQS